MIIDQISNGQISANHAAEKYNVSRSSIQYWTKKYSTLEQKKRGMSKKDEIKRLKERIEELEFQKDFQQDIIADMELITGVDMSKKSLLKKNHIGSTFDGHISRVFIRFQKFQKFRKILIQLYPLVPKNMVSHAWEKSW